jgi:GNAT superfamily N-acetyltransferase
MNAGESRQLLGVLNCDFRCTLSGPLLFWGFMDIINYRSIKNSKHVRFWKYWASMKKIEIVRLNQLPFDDLQPLLVESREQDFEFLERLVAEYVNETNQFGKPGEALFGAYCDHQLIAIGGLNRDPYSQESDIARVRHVYVLSSWRNQGVGKQLVRRIIDEAKKDFRLLTLRTFNQQAGRFYRMMGFKNKPEMKDASHHLVLDGQ